MLKTWFAMLLSGVWMVIGMKMNVEPQTLWLGSCIIAAGGLACND